VGSISRPVSVAGLDVTGVDYVVDGDLIKTV
jgi:hypothetical protein